MASIPSYLRLYRKAQQTIALRVERSLSTHSSIKTEVGEGEEEYKHPQSFVKVRFEPGEWDVDRRDPLFRPPFKSRAKIISAEDFAARPRVGFQEEFDSLRDAMVTLTWMDGRASGAVYDAYLELMMTQTGPTSHEYIMRVLGQKFNITAQRAACIVELAHREEQQRKAGDRIYDDAQELVDGKIRDHIRRAYSEYREQDPLSFVEDPVGVTGFPDTENIVGIHKVVDDVFDVESLTKDALIREEKDARLKIDRHIYVEDVDEEKLEVPLSKEVKKLITRKQEFQNLSQRHEEFKPASKGGKANRQEWKYVAHIINTQGRKKTKRTSWEKKHMRVVDTIVEQNGELRPANVAESKQVPWRPKSKGNEKSFQEVKAAWLDRVNKGTKGGWGRYQAPLSPPDSKNSATSLFSSSKSVPDLSNDQEDTDLEKPIPDSSTESKDDHEINDDSDKP
jgi:hypothetical protein